MGPLANHYRFIEKNSHNLARTLFRYMANYRAEAGKAAAHSRPPGRHRHRSLRHERHLLLRPRPAEKESLDDSSSIELADYFCLMARRRIEHSFDALNHNDDKAANELAKSVLDGKMKWLEEGVIWVGPRE